LEKVCRFAKTLTGCEPTGTKFANPRAYLGSTLILGGHKSETRNPKQIQSSKAEMLKTTPASEVSVIEPLGI
jgi:hypothetical protein